MLDLVGNVKYEYTKIRAHPEEGIMASGEDLKPFKLPLLQYVCDNQDFRQNPQGIISQVFYLQEGQSSWLMGREIKTWGQGHRGYKYDGLFEKCVWRFFARLGHLRWEFVSEADLPEELQLHLRTLSPGMFCKAVIEVDPVTDYKYPWWERIWDQLKDDFFRFFPPKNQRG